MSEGWRNAENVLCVRLDNMGDVLMATPALRALRQQRAGRRLTLLGSASGAAVAAHIAELDGVIRYDAPWVKQLGGQAAERADAGLRQIPETLRAQRFDAAIIFTTFSQSALPAVDVLAGGDTVMGLVIARKNGDTFKALIGASSELTKVASDGDMRRRTA